MKLCYHCMTQISSDRATTCPNCGKSLEPEEQKPRFLRPGTVLGGKFIVGYHLGSGGFGNTYIGWDRMLQRKVAIKEFYPEQYCGRGQDGLTVMVTDERLVPRYQRGLQQFLVEARNVAALHDVQGVVEISNFFEENATGYIIMEYLEGMDVRTILKKSGNKKDYEWSRRVVLTVLYTLKEVHKRGVLHRDIAPDNIFVTKDGIVKLIDFGAAKNVSVVDSSKDVWLKAGYAPIEQYKNTFEQGPYTDLYAVAALFYRMLTGQKPIPAIERLEKDSLIPLSDMGISIPEQAEMAIMVCLNIMPEYRLQSAEEFMEALDGKFFIPVYEPTWILPKEKPRGIKGKLGALPTGAKVALCLLGIALIGGTGVGVMTALNHQAQTSMGSVSQIVMADLTGKTEEEVLAYINELSDQGLEVEYQEKGTVFNLDKPDGTVAEQEPKAGTTLHELQSKSEAKKDQRQQSEDEKIIIQVTLNSQTKLHYSDLKNMGNAYAIAKALKIETADKDHFIAEGTGGKNYYDLVSLEISGMSITPEDLQSEANESKELTYNKDDIKIHYYETRFFYWKKLPDFVNEVKNTKNLKEYPTWRYASETKKEKDGKKALQDSMIDRNYYAIQGEHEEGDIIAQNIAAGEEYDESHPGDETLKLSVIGHVLDYEGKTSAEFVRDLDGVVGNYGCMYPSGIAADPGNQKIIGVEVYDTSENESARTKKVSYFTPDMSVYIEITVEAPAASTPSTSAPGNNSGNYTAPSQSYDNSYTAPNNGGGSNYTAPSTGTGGGSGVDDGGRTIF